MTDEATRPPTPWPGIRSSAWLALTLAAMAAIAYGSSLSLEFMGDDYVFLGHTVHARFTELWSRDHTDFGWYRPWSREFHFWSLVRVAGLNPTAFRLSGLVLWIADLLLFNTFLSRFLPRPVPALATVAVSTLALWGTPLIWISGSQDLWMLFFAMLTLLLHSRGSSLAATACFGLALLGKETAAVLPALLVAYSLLVDRVSLAGALRRVTGALAILLAWSFWHPTLLSRFTTEAAHVPEVESRGSIVTVFLRSLGAHVNLDLLPHPESVDFALVLEGLGTACIAAVALWLAFREADAPDGIEARPISKGPLRFAAVWAVIGWAPLALPSIGWHAYYGCLGVLGTWTLLAALLARHRRFAMAVVISLALLRTASAATLSWDWGNPWYQRRAGNVVTMIREQLRRLHPTLPRHSRVYFGRIPNNVGLVAGRSPAIRIWYDDPTLSADFFSAYAPRSSDDPAGPDYFFRFDTTRVLVEISLDSTDPVTEARVDPAWLDDREKLARLFLDSGDLPNAARTFELISRLPDQARAGLLAAVCWEAAGDDARALGLLTVAATRLHVSRKQLQDEVASLRRSMPRSGSARD